MDRKNRYINFPVSMLKGFLLNSNDVANDIIDYGLYYHSTTLHYKSEKKRFDETCNMYRITLVDPGLALINGRNLFEKYDHSKSLPKVGANITMLLEFCNNDEKPEFDKVVFLGFLAIKSILNTKPYYKLTNNYWLSRMDGKSKAISDVSELSEEIRKYSNEYQTKKIKKELINSWGLVHYSRYTRGFYVSFKLSLEDLIYEAEKRRKSTLEKQRKFEEDVALSRALERLKFHSS